MFSLSATQRTNLATPPSTDLKIFGEWEWLEEKHLKKKNRKSWRKLHLGLDLVSGEIFCSDLTTDDVDDPVNQFLADGAYDGEPTCNLLALRLGR